jgi:DNA-binding HxlR family transcriptional regulator
VICRLKTQTNEKCEKLNTTNKYNKSILLESLNKQKVYEDDYISVNDLRQSDIDILEILFDNGDENTIATFTFNGLKVRSNLHQEILSRSLKRLKELGLVDKNETGYNLNKKGKLLFSELKNILNEKISNQTKYTQIIQLSVPFQIPNQQIVQNLSGKYFGSLRWIGMIQNIRGYQLKWKDIEDFMEIILHLSNNNIIIETNEDKELNISKAFSYSTKIIESIGSIGMKNNNLFIYPINDKEFNKITN